MTTTVLLAAAIIELAAAANTTWPQVLPISGSKTFSDPPTARLDLTINNSTGKPEFQLSCRSGDLEDKEFNYSGLFHCRLYSLTSESRLPSLLFEDEHPTADWEGRARFLLNNVVGRCARVPEWGATRTFRLRGIRLELAIRDIHLRGTLDNPDVSRFTFSYSVGADPTATTPIAEKPHGEQPKWFNTTDESCLRDAMSNPR